MVASHRLWGRRRFAYELNHGPRAITSSSRSRRAGGAGRARPDPAPRRRGRPPQGDPPPGRRGRPPRPHRRSAAAATERTEEQAMANGNSITLVGNITRDPELRFTASGQAMATVRPGRQPPLAEPPDQRVGGADVVLRRRLLARDGRERGESLSKGAASSSPAASSSARGRPRTARSGRRSRSSPTRSAQPALGHRPASRRPRRDGPRRRRQRWRWRRRRLRARPAANPSPTTTTRSPSDGQGSRPSTRQEQGQRAARQEEGRASSSRRRSTGSTTRTSTCSAGSCPTGARSGPAG